MSQSSQRPRGTVSSLTHPHTSEFLHQHGPGAVVHRHSHDYHQLIYVSTGVLAIHTEQGAWIASRDRAAWVPAGMWHEHRAYGPTSVHTIGFDAATAPLPDRSPTIVAVDSLLRELFVAATEPGLAAGEALRIRAVLLDRLRRAHVQPLALPAARDPRLAHACELVIGDLRQPRPLEWLARRANVSERTLTRLFRSEFGMTYPQWRTNVRVFHAMIELSDGATVTETAHGCGWATTSAFVDTFTRTMGQTPGAYRSGSAQPAGSAGRRPAQGGA
jgi:AraC-like DNA-binding protein/mannose-6-phosphate isomerase-like protein (cupin superfamily)